MKLLPSLWPCNDKKDVKKEKDISVYPIIKEKRGRYVYSSPDKMMMMMIMIMRLLLSSSGWQGGCPDGVVRVLEVGVGAGRHHAAREEAQQLRVQHQLALLQQIFFNVCRYFPLHCHWLVSICSPCCRGEPAAGTGSWSGGWPASRSTTPSTWPSSSESHSACHGWQPYSQIPSLVLDNSDMKRMDSYQG